MTVVLTPLPADPATAMPTAEAPAQGAGALLSGEFLTVLLQLVRLDGTMAPVITDPATATSPDAAADDAGRTAIPGADPRPVATLDPPAGGSLVAALDADAGSTGGDVAKDDHATTKTDDSDTAPSALAVATTTAAMVTPLAVPAATVPDAPDASGSSPATAPAPTFERADLSAAATMKPKPAPAFDATPVNPTDRSGNAPNAETPPERDAARVTSRESSDSSGATRLDTAAVIRSTATDATRLLRDRAIVLRAVVAADEPRPAGPEPRSPATTPGETTSVVLEHGTLTTRVDSSTRIEAPAVAPRTVVEQVAERVVILHREGRGAITLRLDPPDLGAVRIEGVMEGGRLRLEIRAEAEPARAALESSLPRLRESLAQQGIATDQVSVHLGLDSGSHFTGGQSAPTTRPLPLPAAATPARLVTPVAPVTTVPADGVDVWV